jgi:hypothetical protein
VWCCERVRERTCAMFARVDLTLGKNIEEKTEKEVIKHLKKGEKADMLEELTLRKD